MNANVTRRQSMLSAAAASVAGAGTAAAADLPNKVKLYQRARGAPQGQIGMMLYSGRLWGKRALQAAVEFYKVEGFSFNRMEMQPDGSLNQHMIEVGFWLDPVTRKPADEWINPLNGLPCKPQHYKSEQKIRFTPTGEALRVGDTPPGMKMRGQINDPITFGDYVWIGEDLIVEMVRPPQPVKDGTDLTTVMPAISTATSLVNYTLRRKDLDTPDTKWVPGTMNFQTMGTWYPWMRMGYETGHTMFQLVGTKLQRTEDIPPSLRQLIDERHPGWLQNPGI